LVDSVSAKVQEVVPTKKEKQNRLTFEAGARVLLRQRNASLEQNADYTKLAWAQPQPRVLPGLELFGGIGYKATKSIVVGTSLGLGGWQEKLGIDVTALSKTPVMQRNPQTGAFSMELPYDKTISHTYQWSVAQAHTELWVRYVPKTIPLIVTLGPTLDIVHRYGSGDNTPTGNLTQLGLAATMRYQPGRLFYEAGLRQPVGNSVLVPNYYRINYQYILVGIGYTW
jgi:hypothetical protein